MKPLKDVCLIRAVVTELLSITLFGSISMGLLAAYPPTFKSKAVPGESPLEQSKYRITIVDLKPLRLHVSADITVDGNMLEMDDTYPAELPAMAAKGWPSLISNLTVTDGTGKQIAVTVAGNKGWQLPSSIHSNLHLSYDVDYSLFASSGWSSPLESAFADDDDVIVAGRSVFIITPAQPAPINVEFTTPKGWIPIMPWQPKKGISSQYSVRSRQDLSNNMLVLSKNKPDVVTAAGFNMQIVTMGHWRPLRSLVSEVLKTIITREVDLMHYTERETYNVVLLPISDQGGEAYRQSFVYCFKDPDKENKGIWANTLAHEIFHYWNYARLEGADYASSQWFQEGFTEYVANLVTVTGRIIDADAFVSKLSQHVNNYRKLTTTLENYGTHKGPPLYSAGALVALMWDIKIRVASDGKRNISDFFQNLMKQTDYGRRKYGWNDIKVALSATADSDWEGFYQAHIRGHEPLPVAQVLPLAGLRLSKLADGGEQVEIDPTSLPKAKFFWRAYIGTAAAKR